MIEDPVVEEIRKYRAEHATRYGNDLKKICEALRKQEKKSQKEFVNFGPKLLQPRQYGAFVQGPHGNEHRPLSQ